MRPRNYQVFAPLARPSAALVPRRRPALATRARGLTCAPGHQINEHVWSTPLAKRISEIVSATGPVSLANYMRMCLTADSGSYYADAVGKSSHDQFGAKGDFVTSPEISQVFGELLGVWFVAEWISQGRPKTGVQLIEVGPGRGTLMDDMLRTITHFPDMAQSIDAIYMVESSPRLRERQKINLCGPNAKMTESREGYHSTCKYLNLPMVWTEIIKSIPIDPCKTPFIVAHEFFDALPTHAFQSVSVLDVPAVPSTASTPAAMSRPSLQWREMVVVPLPALSRLPTLPRGLNGDPPEFQLTLATAPTRHSQFLTESSARYSKLRSIPNAVIEISPDAALYAADFAARIGGSDKHPKTTPSGAALIIDYGPSDTVPVNSLRGIHRHRRVSPFSAPGRVDISADVDFAGLAEAALRSSVAVEVHGPVPQADFLEHMGIRERADVLRAAAPAADADPIRRSWQRLVDRGPDGMGKVYRALAILPENGGQRRPVGFGGDLPGDV